MKTVAFLSTVAALGSLSRGFAADELPPVSISFVCYTNEVNWLKAVECVGYRVPDQLAAKYYKRDDELWRALAVDPEYRRFAEFFPIGKYAIFKVVNKSGEFLLWTVDLMTVWPKDGSALYRVSPSDCETNENLRSSFYSSEPGTERFLAVQAPSACTNWQCEFALFSKKRPLTRLIGPAINE